MVSVFVNGEKLRDGIISPEWSGDAALAARTFSVGLPIDRADSVALGDRLEAHVHGKVIFVGIVLFKEADAKARTARVSAMDFGVYLSRNMTIGTFRGYAHEIAARIAGEIGAEAGAIAKGGRRLRVLSIGDRSYLDVLRRCYGDDRRIYMERTALNIRAPKVVLTVDGSSLTESRTTASAEDMVNRVLAIRSKRKRAEVQNSGDRKKYGTFTGVYHIVRGHDYEPESALRGVKERLYIAGLGSEDARAGDLLQVREGCAGVNGTFRIVADRHRFLSGMSVHLMELELEPWG